MTTTPDLAGTFASLEKRFRPGQVQRETVYYLSLGDAADQKWTLILSPDSCRASAGKAEKADCVLKVSAELFAKLVAGEWKPSVTDFMTGKIKTSDIELLQRLQASFGL